MAESRSDRIDAIIDLTGDKVLLAGLVTRKQAAAFLAVSERTIANLQASGELRPVRIGRAVRYSLRDLEALIESKRSSHPA